MHPPIAEQQPQYQNQNSGSTEEEMDQKQDAGPAKSTLAAIKITQTKPTMITAAALKRRWTKNKMLDQIQNNLIAEESSQHYAESTPQTRPAKSTVAAIKIRWTKQGARLDQSHNIMHNSESLQPTMTDSEPRHPRKTPAVDSMGLGASVITEAAAALISSTPGN